MASYKYGSSGTGVEELRKKLNEKGNYNLEVDGRYGPKTQEAVTDYQRKNNLTVDGKAGPETLGHINGSISNAVSQPTTPANAQNQNANTVQPSVQQTAKERLSVLQKGYSSSTDEALDMLYDKVVNQKPFEYDVMGDPAYNQYAQTFRRNAALMSEDAMAQAAQLTGGYGSSYGQAVGTQAYNEQMSKLNDIVPELRENAYAKYNDERAKALENLALLLNERDYDRSILESDRAFAEQQRQFDAGVALDKEQLAFQKYQYENEIKREDSLRDQERDALAMEMGFSSWNDYANAVKKGEYKPGQNNRNVSLTDFSEKFLTDAISAWKSNGTEGLEDYFSDHVDEYSFSDLDSLGKLIESMYPEGNDRKVVFPEGVKQMHSITDVENYLKETIGTGTAKTLDKSAEGFLNSLLTAEEMQKDGIDDEFDKNNPDQYGAYLTGQLKEFLQNRQRR